MNEEERQREMLKIILLIASILNDHDCELVFNILAFMIVNTVHQACDTRSEANDLLKDLFDGIMQNIDRNTHDGMLVGPVVTLQ